MEKEKVGGEKERLSLEGDLKEIDSKISFALRKG